MKKPTYFTFSKEMHLSDALTKHFKLNLKEVESLYRLGAIYEKDRRIFENKLLPAKTELKLYLSPGRFPVNGIKWRSLLIQETEDFLIIDKPPGIPTHATVDNWYENALFQCRSLLSVDLYVTQRLDTPTSGLVLFAKTKNFQRLFNQWLKDGKIKKTYEALTEFPPQEGEWTHFMAPSEKTPKRVFATEEPGYLQCKITIKGIIPIVLNEKTFYRTQVDLGTGRTHQIRAQFSFLDHPVVNDALYGGHRAIPMQGRAIGLSCVGLDFYPDHSYRLQRDWSAFILKH